MTRLILMRHGETTANVRRLLDTRPPGAPLTPRGEEQARAAGRRWPRWAPEGVDGVLCSRAVRARRTAELATAAYLGASGGARPPLRVVSGIHEVDVGDHEMCGDDDAHAAYAAALAGWVRGEAGARVGGGEDHRDVLARVRPVLERLAADGGNRVMVAHGGLIRVVAAHAAGVDPDFALAHRIPNCAAVVLDTAGRGFGGWRVLAWPGAGGPVPAARR